MTAVTCRCKKPYMRGGLPFGCGQCMPCRIKRRRLWVHRCLLEQRMHGDTSFLTLTYDEENHAKLQNGSLNFRHHTNFLDSLRKRYKTNPIRYYGVGEYGERSSRAHFHYILFGYPTCSGQRCSDTSGRYTCQACELIKLSWRKGFHYLGDATKDSISYVASYVTKGWTHENDYNKTGLNGRAPESARMSTGIGGTAIDQIAQTFLTDLSFSENFLGETGDVPSVLKTDGRLYPIGRYLKSRFRRNLGWTETNLPEEKLNAWKEEMRQLYKENFGDTALKTSNETKRALLQALNKDTITHIESKFKKYNLVGAL